MKFKQPCGLFMTWSEAGSYSMDLCRPFSMGQLAFYACVCVCMCVGIYKSLYVCSCISEYISLGQQVCSCKCVSSICMHFCTSLHTLCLTACLVNMYVGVLVLCSYIQDTIVGFTECPSTARSFPSKLAQ